MVQIDGNKQWLHKMFGKGKGKSTYGENVVKPKNAPVCSNHLFDLFSPFQKLNSGKLEISFITYCKFEKIYSQKRSKNIIPFFYYLAHWLRSALIL